MDENIFLILCRKVTKELYLNYSQINMKNLYFISDSEPDINKSNIIYLDTKEVFVKNFKGLHSRIPVTSWDKVFYFLNQHIREKNIFFKNYWIIEDDCYLNKNIFMDYISNTINNDESDLILYGWYKKFGIHSWGHWGKNNNIFSKKELCASINQIIRISNNLLTEVLDFQKIHNKFIFHEILFASLVNKFNLKVNNYNYNDKIHVCAVERNSLLFNNYKNKRKDEIYQDITNKNYIIVHPFKDWYNYAF